MFINNTNNIFGLTRKPVAWCLSLVMAFGPMSAVPTVEAKPQLDTVLNLPTPGSLVKPSETYVPALLKGIKLFKQNPFQFEFIFDSGQMQESADQLNAEAQKLIKYFLAALTVPEDQLWVNLSPYEKDRIIPERFGMTKMGRDLLAQDYMLKQLSSSLMVPEEATGSLFWEKFYKEIYAQLGTTDVPLDTFHKIWIVPEQAEVFIYENTLYIAQSRLKVMLEDDYVNLPAHALGERGQSAKADTKRNVSTQVMRETIIPIIEEEVNNGKTFANLRQIFHSMILATWYKKNLKQGLLNELFVNQGRTSGIDNEDEEINQKIYEQYVEALEVGVYDAIKEEYDPLTQEVLPRKYFSGGFGYADVVREGHSRERPDLVDAFVNNLHGEVSALMVSLAVLCSGGSGCSSPENIKLLGEIVREDNIARPLWLPLDRERAVAGQADADAAMKTDQVEEQIERLKGLKRELEKGNLTKTVHLGDVHAQPAELERVLKTVLEHVESGEPLTVVGHGDYFGFNGQDVKVFRLLKELKLLEAQYDHIQIHFLLGNHDEYLIRAILLDDKEARERWLGPMYGNLTLEVFEDESTRESIEEVALFLLQNTRIYHMDEWGYLSVHAGTEMDDLGNPEFGLTEILEWQDTWESIQEDLLRQPVLIKEPSLIKDHIVRGRIRKFFEATQTVLGGSHLALHRQENFEPSVSHVVETKEGFSKLDRLLIQMGVNGLIIGHGMHDGLLNVDNRLFGVDVNHPQFWGKQGFLVFDNEGIGFSRYELGLSKQITLMDKDERLEHLEKQIARFEGALTSKGGLSEDEDFEGRKVVSLDSAMIAPFQSKKKEVGGIDLNPANFMLYQDGQMVEFEFENTIQREDLPTTIDGILPVILQMNPITNLPLLLGK